MPFTLCHPAAVAIIPAPLRRQVPLAALAIGAMTPDFEYLFRLRTLSLWSHSVPGVFLFCLPAGLLAWLAWEHIARGPTRELLALRHDRPARPMTFRTLSLAALAILLGAFTHIGWDAFTHAGRLGATLIPQLEHEAALLGDYSLRWFGVMQHLSTLAGAIVLGIWFVGEQRRHGRPWGGRQATLALVLIAGAGIVTGALNAFVPHTLGDARYPGRMGLLARFAIGGMIGTGGALLAYSGLRRRTSWVLSSELDRL
jgi:hypothetical protein